MKTLCLAILMALCLFTKAQTCELMKTETQQTFHFHIFSAKKQRALLSISDTTGAILWAKKVVIKKGESSPVLRYLAKLHSGRYIIRIGSFFVRQVMI